MSIFNNKNYTYKELSFDEYSLLKDIFEEYNAIDPQNDPSLIKVSAAFDSNNKLVGFMCLRLKPIVEPVWIKKENRGRVSIRKLLSILELPFKEARQGKLFCTPSSRKMETLVKRLGFSKLKNDCFVKDFN